MAGPIAHGVHDGLHRKRRARAPRHGSPLAAWSYFVTVTLGLSWVTFATLGGVDRAVELAVMMTWPPVIGAWLARLVRGEPAERSRPRGRDLAIAAAIAALAAAAAIGIALGAETVRADAPGLALIAVQGLVAEYAWRGDPLRWLVERAGAPAGVVIHGLAYGLWFAPLGVVVVAIAAVAGVVLGALRRWAQSSRSRNAK